MNSASLFLTALDIQYKKMFVLAGSTHRDLDNIHNFHNDLISTHTDLKKDVGLYRPISPNSDEDVSYNSENSPPSNALSHFGQAIPEIFIQQPLTNMDLHFQLNNNNYKNNNNIGDCLAKSRNEDAQKTKGYYDNREQRRRSAIYLPRNSDLMVHRAHGLALRFKSRSHTMRIDSCPANLLNNSPYDQLSQAIYDVFTSKAQKPDVYERKVQLWRDMFLNLRKCFRHYALYIVGSTMTSFGLNSSDIDMCLLTRSHTDDPRMGSLQHLYYIRNHLLKHNFITNSELILAKVPILKFRDQSHGFEIDLNCNNAVGIYNSHLLYSYACCDWRVRPLAIMVKLWAQANRINDAKNLTVSSYSWTLMLLHYLQCGVSPAVLPCLQSLYPEYFTMMEYKFPDVNEDVPFLENCLSDNRQSLAELFIGFFAYYANFDFERYAVSVRVGGRLPIEQCKQMKAPKNDPYQWKYLCIEEPFDFTNTARSVFDLTAFRFIKTIIAATYEELVRTKMLNNVLPVNLSAKPPLVVY